MTMTKDNARKRASELRDLLWKVQSELNTCEKHEAPRLMAIHDSISAEYRYLEAYAEAS
jgi:hypothetical protein